VGEVTPDAVEELLGVALTGEVARNRRPDGILARLAGGGGGEPAYRRGSVRRPASRYRRGGHPSKRPTWGHRAGHPSHVWPCSGWGLPSRPGHPGRWCALTAPFHPCLCTASRAIGGLFSVALSCGSPRLAVSQHLALWSPDLPQPAAAPKRRPGRGHPVGSPPPGTFSHVPAPAASKASQCTRPGWLTGT